MQKIKFDFSKALDAAEINRMAPFFQVALDQLAEKTGSGNDFLGWHDLPFEYDKNEFARIRQAASAIREHSEMLIVIGIGGSFLGAKAAI